MALIQRTSAEELGTLWALRRRAAGAHTGARGELLSDNRELQRMNEELQTAKLELESANADLRTVNDALQRHISELSRLSADVLNLFSAIDIPIIVLDRKQRIQRFTPRARRLFSVMSSYVGRPLTELQLNVDVPDLQKQIAEVIATACGKELELQLEAGHWYRLQLRPYVDADDRIAGAVLSLLDIDSFKRDVDAARRAQADAERDNAAKDQLLAELAHELRTPLWITLMHARVLQEYPADDQIQRAGQVLERSALHQARLIDDLLDITRIVANKLQTKSTRVDLRSVVRAALEATTDAANRKSIELLSALGSDACTVQGDPTRLQQVITNLLTNAIKFTPERGSVSVTLESESNQAALRVTDTGVGISPEFLPHVFERFAQEASSRGLTNGGLGLGLSIVRHLVELHGGHVDATSEGLGKGATFCVTLPLAPMQHAAPSATEYSHE